MKIERIVFRNISDTDGNIYHTWIDITKDENPCVTIQKETDKKKDTYLISTLFHHALAAGDDDCFIIPDGYPDGQNIVEFYSPEIKRLTKDILLRFPIVLGRLEIKVLFEPNDPNLPF